MSLIEIRAEFRCDGCGRLFSVQPDSTREAAGVEWSAYDYAESGVMDSVRYKGPNSPDGFEGSSSLRDGRHLCGSCAAIQYDEGWPAQARGPID